MIRAKRTSFRVDFRKLLSGRANQLDRFGSAPSVEAVAAGPAKYPAITVELADLSGEMWPILRRVSYAMSDADIDDAEIERYNSEMKAGNDPVGVSRRWVTVQR